MYLTNVALQWHVFIGIPQRTWSPTLPLLRLGTRRWAATSQSLPKPTTLPMTNCRHDTLRTWGKPWAQCKSSTTEWLLDLSAEMRLLPLNKWATSSSRCSKWSCWPGLTNTCSPLTQFTIILAVPVLHSDWDFLFLFFKEGKMVIVVALRHVQIQPFICCKNKVQITGYKYYFYMM